jgi:hypothetical protein
LVREPRGRFQSWNLFLTYFKCNLGRDEFVEKLQQQQVEPGVKYFGGRRVDRNGSPEFHVLLEFPKQLRRTKREDFDLVVHGTNAHPLWQYADDLFGVQEYYGRHTEVFGECFVAKNDTAAHKRKNGKEAHKRRNGTAARKRKNDAVARKRMYDVIFRELTAEAMHDKMREMDPEEWATRFPDNNAAFEYMEKRHKM